MRVQVSPISSAFIIFNRVNHYIKYLIVFGLMIFVVICNDSGKRSSSVLGTESTTTEIYLYALLNQLCNIHIIIMNIYTHFPVGVLVNSKKLSHVAQPL